MIKKIAFLGGYLSAFCLCLALLFFSQSLLGAKKTKLKAEAIEVEFYRANLEDTRKEERKIMYDRMNEYSIQQTIDQASKFENAELLLIISIVIFGFTYLPYQFYSKYQRSNQEIQYS